jgi:hypothetical protein
VTFLLDRSGPMEEGLRAVPIAKALRKGFGLVVLSHG